MRKRGSSPVHYFLGCEWKRLLRTHLLDSSAVLQWLLTSHGIQVGGFEGCHTSTVLPPAPMLQKPHLPCRSTLSLHFFFTSNQMQTLRKSMRAIPPASGGFASGPLHNTVQLYRRRSKRLSGCCPLNILRFVSIFNTHLILNELSPNKCQALNPLPQEHLKGSLLI